MKEMLAKLVLNKMVIKIILMFLTYAASKSSNTIDDELVELIKEGFGK